MRELISEADILDMNVDWSAVTRRAVQAGQAELAAILAEVPAWDFGPELNAMEPPF